jgi:hypothetical protein
MKHPPDRIRCAKHTTQLAKGDVIHISGLGGFTVESVAPYFSQAVIRLAFGQLAVICDRDLTWNPVITGAPVYLHGYDACPGCGGRGIIWR